MALNGHRELLVNSIVNDDVESVRDLLTSLSEEDRLCLLTIQDERGNTIFHVAAGRGCTEIIKCMLDQLTPTQCLEILSVRNILARTSLDCAKEYSRSDTVACIEEYQMRSAAVHQGLPSPEEEEMQEHHVLAIGQDTSILTRNEMAELKAMVTSLLADREGSKSEMENLKTIISDLQRDGDKMQQRLVLLEKEKTLQQKQIAYRKPYVKLLDHVDRKAADGGSFDADDSLSLSLPLTLSTGSKPGVLKSMEPKSSHLPKLAEKVDGSSFPGGISKADRESLSMSLHLSRYSMIYEGKIPHHPHPTELPAIDESVMGSLTDPQEKNSNNTASRQQLMDPIEMLGLPAESVPTLNEFSTVGDISRQQVADFTTESIGETDLSEEVNDNDEQVSGINSSSEIGGQVGVDFESSSVVDSGLEQIAEFPTRSVGETDGSLNLSNLLNSLQVSGINGSSQLGGQVSADLGSSDVVDAGFGPSRGVGAGLEPNKEGDTGLGTSKEVGANLGSNGVVDIGLGPSRGVGPGLGPSKGVDTGLGPSRGVGDGLESSSITTEDSSLAVDSSMEEGH